MKERDRKTATCPQQQRSREERRNICLATQRKGKKEPYLQAIYACCRQVSKSMTCLYHLQYPHSIQHKHCNRSHTTVNGQTTGQYQSCSAAQFRVQVTNNNYLYLPVLNSIDRPRHPQPIRRPALQSLLLSKILTGLHNNWVIPSEMFSVLRCQEGRS